MIYFKKVWFNAEDEAMLEAALTKFSEERGSLAGFQPKTAAPFFAMQTVKNRINYTRLMSRFDRFVPKLIFNTAIKGGNRVCRLRLGNRSTGILLLISGGIAANMTLTDQHTPRYGGLLILSTALVIFILLAMLECRQTEIKIKRAISTYRLVQRAKQLHKA